VVLHLDPEHRRGSFDMRDLSAVLDNEEPLPIRPCDLVQ
jgi:hypothetical protein